MSTAQKIFLSRGLEHFLHASFFCDRRFSMFEQVWLENASKRNVYLRNKGIKVRQHGKHLIYFTRLLLSCPNLSLCSDKEKGSVNLENKWYLFMSKLSWQYHVKLASSECKHVKTNSKWSLHQSTLSAIKCIAIEHDRNFRGISFTRIVFAWLQFSESDLWSDKRIHEHKILTNPSRLKREWVFFKQTSGNNLWP